VSSYPAVGEPPTFALLSRCFAFRPDARFTGLLGPDFFSGPADKHHLHFGSGKGDTFNPPVTTWAWLTQALSPVKSCAAACARVLVLSASLGRPLPSANPGAFCKARGKLPAAFLKDAALSLGESVERQALPYWRWKRRPVKVADGALVQLPDTPANLEKYPQQRSQKPGTGYTCMRLVVLLAFATACVLAAATGPYRGKNSGEMSLLWSLFERIEPGDVLLGDRYYGCYLLLAGLPLRKADGCFRLPVHKEEGFACGRRLGPDDWLQTWDKPCRPKWIDKDSWDALPAQVQVRVLRLRVGRPGWRTRRVCLATTLLDAAAYPATEVAALYLARWSAELDIRAIKQGLGAKRLLCKSPEMVEAELWAQLLAYNLTRCVMAQAALDRGQCPRQLSFAGAVATLDAFRWLLCCSDRDPEFLGEVLSVALAARRVGNRPGRYEPREVKHRQRKYKELKKSRQQRRQELRRSGEEADDKGRKGAGKDRPSGRQR
jgi:putative transposase